MQHSWQNKLGTLREDAATYSVLNIMPTYPIFNLNTMVTITGKSYNALNNAVSELLRAGIITQVSSGNRNRIYSSDDVLEFLNWLESQTYPKYPSPREAYFKLIQ